LIVAYVLIGVYLELKGERRALSNFGLERDVTFILLNDLLGNS